MRTFSLLKAFRLLFVFALINFTTHAAMAKDGINDIPKENSPSLSFSTGQLIVNASITVRYNLKSDVKLSDNASLANAHGLNIRSSGNQTLRKGEGIFRVKINGVAPEEAGLYSININSGKLKSELWFSVVDAPKSNNPLSAKPDLTEITTAGNSFSKERDITIDLKEGSLSATLGFDDLLGASDGIEIRYAGNSKTFVLGTYVIPVNIKGSSSVNTGSYNIALNAVDGVTTKHRVNVKVVKTINRFTCSDVTVNATAGAAFSETKPISLVLNPTSTLSLTAKQLLSSSDGIEIRYSGSSQTFYPGENTINIMISGGSAVEPGKYYFTIDKIPDIVSACNITVHVSDEKIIGKMQNATIDINAPADQSYSERREITMTINNSSLDLEGNQLIGFLPGIQIRYNGPTKTYYPGTYKFRTIINVDGPSIGTGVYNVPVNLLSEVSSRDEIKVTIR